jgi:protocatechuate 3,4-dioxygenase beta subunit
LHRDGRYSLYDAEIAAENYLRGVQVSADDGRLTFKTVFPGAYAGRWPHMHFEVYESVDAATNGTGKLRTSQLALPRQTCEQVYANTGYEQSARNLQQTSLDADMVFGDGYASQLASASGNVGDGIALKLNVGV